MKVGKRTTPVVDRGRKEGQREEKKTYMSSSELLHGFPCELLHHTSLGACPCKDVFSPKKVEDGRTATKGRTRIHASMGRVMEDREDKREDGEDANDHVRVAVVRSPRGRPSLQHQEQTTESPTPRPLEVDRPVRTTQRT